MTTALVFASISAVAAAIVMVMLGAPAGAAGVALVAIVAGLYSIIIVVDNVADRLEEKPARPRPRGTLDTI